MELSDLQKYHFELPEHLLRTEGLEPRDSAKLFVYDTENDLVLHDIFRNIGSYLPKNSLLVFNETRVVPARLWLQKETGGKIEAFFLVNEWSGDAENIPILTDRKLQIGQTISCKDISFTVMRQEENKFFVALNKNVSKSLEQVLFEYGETPIPPYLKKNSQTEAKLRSRYQTVFAENGNSVAAPTASLHFTKNLLNDLAERGVQMETISLQIGLGTFAPLKEENFTNGTLHTEHVTYTRDFLETLRHKSERKIFAVGTTALRAIESVKRKEIKSAGSYPTDIFIQPGDSFAFTEGLITNFHTPSSSLLLLVDAFLQHKGAKRNILDLYREAIEKEYAFYSFGDAMLIL